MSNSFLLGRGNLVVGKSTIDGLSATAPDEEED